jgi:signal transduction histidine kinase
MNSLLPHFPVAAQEAPLGGTEVIHYPLTEVRSVRVDEFVHELRQPLSVIDSLAFYLEMIAPNEEFRAHLQKIQAMVFQANSILERVGVDGGEL